VLAKGTTCFAAFRLATIYLPQCLLLKWVVVKYSGLSQGGKCPTVQFEVEVHTDV